VVPGAQAQVDWREEGDHFHDPFTCFAASMDLAIVGLTQAMQASPIGAVGASTTAVVKSRKSSCPDALTRSAVNVLDVAITEIATPPHGTQPPLLHLVRLGLQFDLSSAGPVLIAPSIHSSASALNTPPKDARSVK